MATSTTPPGGSGTSSAPSPLSTSSAATAAEAPSRPSGGGVARAAALTILLVLLSRVAGVLRDMVMAARFGQGPEVTIFRTAFDVPDLIALVIAGGGLSSVFIPIFTRYWNEGQEEEAWKVFGSVVTIVGTLVATLVVLLELGAEIVTRLLNPLYTSAESVALAASYTRILLPIQWCLMVGGLMMATLYARKRFLIPGVGPILYNVGQIAGAWFFGQTLGIAAVAWGALIGAFVGSVLLPAWEMRRIGVNWRLGLDFKHPGVVRMGTLMIPVLIGQSLSQLNMWLTGRFLPDDARRAALTYAYNLTQAPIGIFAQAFGIVLLPTISLLAAKKDWTGYRTTLSDGVRRVFFLTIPASIIMAALAAPLIRIFLKGGKFTEADVPMAATALICYSIATFAWSGSSILYRGFHAMQDTKTPVLITTPLVGVFILLAAIYRNMDPAGYIGYPLSTSLVGTLAMFLMLFMLQKKACALDMRGIVSSTVKITAASAAAGAVAWTLARFLEQALPTGKLGSLITVLAAGGLSLVVYAVVCYLLRVPELRTIKEMFRRPKASADASAAADDTPAAP